MQWLKWNGQSGRRTEKIIIIKLVFDDIAIKLPNTQKSITIPNVVETLIWDEPLYAIASTIVQIILWDD